MSNLLQTYAFVLKNYTSRIRKKAAKNLDYVWKKTRTDRLPVQVANRLTDLLAIRQKLIENRDPDNQQTLYKVERQIQKLLSESIEGGIRRELPYNIDSLKLGQEESSKGFRTLFYQYSPSGKEQKKILPRSTFIPRESNLPDSPNWSKTEVHVQPKDLPPGETNTLSGWTVDSYARFTGDYLPRIKQLQRRRENLYYDKLELQDLENAGNVQELREMGVEHGKMEVQKRSQDYYNEFRSLERDEKVLTDELRQLLGDRETVFYDFNTFEVNLTKDKQSGREYPVLYYRTRKPTKREMATSSTLTKSDYNRLKELLPSNRLATPESLSDFLVGTAKILYTSYIEKLYRIPIPKSASSQKVKKILSTLVSKVDSNIKRLVEDRGLNVVDDSELTLNQQVERHEIMNKIFLKAFQEYKNALNNTKDDDEKEPDSKETLESGIIDSDLRGYYEHLIEDFTNLDRPEVGDVSTLDKTLRQILKQIDNEVYERFISTDLNDDYGHSTSDKSKKKESVELLDIIFDKGKDKYQETIDSMNLGSDDTFVTSLKEAGKWHQEVMSTLEKLAEKYQTKEPLRTIFLEDILEVLHKDLKKNFLHSELNVDNVKGLTRSEEKERKNYLEALKKEAIRSFENKLKQQAKLSKEALKSQEKRSKLDKIRKAPKESTLEEQIDVEEDIDDLSGYFDKESESGSSAAYEEGLVGDIDEKLVDSLEETRKSPQQELREEEEKGLQKYIGKKPKKKVDEDKTFQEAPREKTVEDAWSELGYSTTTDWKDLFSARQLQYRHSLSKVKRVLGNSSQGMDELVPYYVRLASLIQNPNTLEKVTLKILKKYCALKQSNPSIVAQVFALKMKEYGFEIDSQVLEEALNDKR